MNPAPTPPGLAYRFGLVVLGLCQVVANHVNRDCSNEPFIACIYFSLRRRLKRFERLFARAQAGLVLSAARDAAASSGEAGASSPPPGDPVAATAGGASPADLGSAASGGAARKARKPYERLPRKAGWLTTMIPYKAALYWYRLDDLLRDPEMVAFLATSRKARRLLRPLWHALCGDKLPACLREPPRSATRTEPPEAGTQATAAPARARSRATATASGAKAQEFGSDWGREERRYAFRAPHRPRRRRA